MKVLLTDPSGYKSIVIAKFLSLNYDVISVLGLETKEIKLVYSKYFSETLSVRIDAYFKEALINIIHLHQVDLVLITNSNELNQIIDIGDAELNALIGYSDVRLYSILNDKEMLSSFCISNLIPSPKRVTLDEIIVGEDYVAKPKIGSSSRGVKYFKKITNDEINLLKGQNNNNLLIQQFIEGFGAGLSVYAVRGEIKAHYTHKRIMEYPITGGSSVYRSPYYNEKMFCIVEKILTLLPWTGFAMFEFKVDKEGNPYLIEVNPRIWGSINQGLLCGINYFQPLLGPTKQDNSANIHTYLSPLVYLSMLKYALDMDFAPIKKFIMNIRHNRADISIIDDYKGFMSLIFRKK